MVSEKSKEGGGAFTVNVKVVVWDREPATAVTVIVEGPIGVNTEVVRVNVEEHAGLHDAGENEAVAPAGKPDAEKDTVCAVPETSVAVIVLITDCPWTTVGSAPLEREKSKDGGATPENSYAPESIAPLTALGVSNAGSTYSYCGVRLYVPSDPGFVPPPMAGEPATR